MRYFLLAVMIILVLSSGCVGRGGTQNNETNETNGYVYNNNSGNNNVVIPRGSFTFRIIGASDFRVRPGEKTRFYVVFNNMDEDEEAHKFVARVLPSAADFDAKSAYKCLYFANCSQMQADMDSWINQTRTQITVNYTHVGLQRFGISIPETANKGVYMYDVIACHDLGFYQCDRSTANWGPILPLSIQILPE